MARRLRPLVRRVPWLLAIAVLCPLGLLVRRQNGLSPDFFNTYFPDTAWTMAVYCGFGLLFDRRARVNLPVSLAVSFLVEISQLFSPPFLVSLRATRLGGLLLGFGFLWSDLVCYTVGALFCAAVQTCISRLRKR